MKPNTLRSHKISLLNRLLLLILTFLFTFITVGSTPWASGEVSLKREFPPVKLNLLSDDGSSEDSQFPVSPLMEEISSESTTEMPSEISNIEGNNPIAQESTTDLEGGAILFGQRVSGVIDNNSDADVFQFKGQAGESVSIALNALSSGFDPAVTLLWGGGQAAVTTTSHPDQRSTLGDDGYFTRPDVYSLSFLESAAQSEVFVEINSPPDGFTLPIFSNPGNISVSGKAGIKGGGTPTNLEVVIVLDASGSMDDDEWNLEIAGAKAILDALDPDKDGLLSSSVAIVQFGVSGVIIAPLSLSRSQVELGLVRDASLSSDTNYDAALSKALEALAPSSPSDSTSELVLFFTDGQGWTYTGPGKGGPLDQFYPKGIVINTFSMVLRSILHN